MGLFSAGDTDDEEDIIMDVVDFDVDFDIDVDRGVPRDIMYSDENPIHDRICSENTNNVDNDGDGNKRRIAESSFELLDRNNILTMKCIMTVCVALSPIFNRVHKEQKK